MRNAWSRASVVLATLTLVWSIQAATPDPGATKPSLERVRILFNVPLDPAFVPDLMAFKRLKSQYGIETDVNVITGADASIKGLIAGQGEFALATLGTGILAVGQQQRIKAAIPAASAPYFSLVVTSDIRDWKDITGKRIGYTATSDSSYWTTVLQLRKRGIDPNGVNWLVVRGGTARVQAMLAGKLDAGQVTVLGALELLRDPRFKRLGEVGKDFPNLLFSAYWVTDRFAREHPDVVQAFAEALMQEHRNAQKKSLYLPAARPLFTGTIDEATLSQSYDILKEMNVWDPNEGRWNREAGDFTAKVLADNQAVERFVPFAEWATTQFVDAARRKLGRYEP